MATDDIDPSHADKFVVAADDLIWSQCVYCKHRVAGPFPVCRAFPGWIPDAILTNAFDHRRHFPGQVGRARLRFRRGLSAKARAGIVAVLDALG